MGPKTEFTQVSNSVLRNPDLSFKAKGLLCLLLSNETGKWVSYQESIERMSQEGPDAIRTGLKELEKAGYLLRIHYVEPKTKRRRGSFWAYTDYPGEFELDGHLEFLKENNLEIQRGSIKDNIKLDFPNLDFPSLDNPRLKRLSNKNKKEKEKTSLNLTPKEQNSITPSMFETFWKLYPRPNKGSKGSCKTVWKRICDRKENRPTWDQIEKAILAQMKTDQWQDARYIPLPTTWLNQERWMDDPAEMGNQSWNASNTLPTSSAREIVKQYFKESKDLESVFLKNCFNPAKELLDAKDKITRAQLAEALTQLHAQIQIERNKNLSGEERSLFPGPVEMISRYLRWIDDNDWITQRSPKMFELKHSLFARFRRDEASKDNYERDPLTGKSHLRS